MVGNRSEEASTGKYLCKTSPVEQAIKHSMSVASCSLSAGWATLSKDVEQAVAKGSNKVKEKYVYRQTKTTTDKVIEQSLNKDVEQWCQTRSNKRGSNKHTKCQQG